jgi:hypothetical protein
MSKMKDVINKHAGTRISHDAAFRVYFLCYKAGARKRNLCFELAFEQFKSLIKKKCFYCGAPPRYNYCSKTTAVPQLMNGVDRSDSARGYTLDNVVPCCTCCNNAKRMMSSEEFIAWARRVVSCADKRK